MVNRGKQKQNSVYDSMMKRNNKVKRGVHGSKSEKRTGLSMSGYTKTIATAVIDDGEH